MAEVFLGLGSNVGNRMHYLQRAIEMLKEHSDIEVIAKSNIYETEPYGLKDQDSFLNMTVKISSKLDPERLLKYIHIVEEKLDRERIIHWGPRTIDIDILLYGKEKIDLPHLQVPHPYMTDRLFVLMPLQEIYDGTIPGSLESIDELIQKHKGKQGIELYRKQLF